MKELKSFFDARIELAEETVISIKALGGHITVRIPSGKLLRRTKWA